MLASFSSVFAGVYGVEARFTWKSTAAINCTDYSKVGRCSTMVNGASMDMPPVTHMARASLTLLVNSADSYLSV
jgi:hypothetical protein